MSPATLAFIGGIGKWVIELITDLASGKKSLEEARKAAAKGYQIDETASDAELKEYT